MNEFPDSESVFTFPSSNQFFFVQNVSKKLDGEPRVPVLFLDENQTGFVNNFLYSNPLQDDVDEIFASDTLSNGILSLDVNPNSPIDRITNEIEDIIAREGKDKVKGKGESDIDDDINIEGISDDDKVANSTPKAEQTIYLCSQCTNAFSSIEECKEHMIKDHKLGSFINSPAKIEESVSESGNSSADNIQENSTNSSKGIQLLGDCSFIDGCENTDSNFLEADGDNSQTQESEAAFFKDPDFITKTFRCNFLGCLMKFSSQKNADLHFACHEPNSKIYICSQANCDKKFELWKKCVSHLWKEHQIDIDLYTCPTCKVYKTPSRFFLRSHAKIHLEEKCYSCTQCQKKFKQKPQLINHVASAHAKQALKKNANPDNSNKWYTEKKCEICFKTYADSKCLKKHIQAVHRKMKPYICNICGHKSAKKAMMQIHIRSHTGEKPYVCTQSGCSYKTGDHNSLRRHQMIHSGKRPYRCKLCSFASIQSSAFKKHILAKHQNEKGGAFMCNLCSFGTINATLYMNHLSDHKNGLIEAEEVFVENVAAANLVCESLGIKHEDELGLQASVTGSSTYAGGSAQTITIEIPNRDLLNTDDEDTTNCFPPDEGIHTGGITIPADPHSEPLLFLPPGCNSEFEGSSLIES